MYVRVACDEAEQPVELPCEADSTLLLSTVQAQFAGCIGLKYYNEGTQAFRGVRLAEGYLYAPETGWQSTVYIAVFPKEHRRRDDSESSPSSSNAAVKTGSAAAAKLNASGKQKCTDLIVLGLSYETSEEKLRKHFERFGPLALVQLKRDSKTQQSKGFAFIRFSQMDAQQNALNESHVIDERACIVKVPDSQLNARDSVRCNKVFVGRITEQLTAEDLRTYFSQFGRVIDVYIPKPFRQFAFVTFAEAEAAQALWGEDHTIRGVEVHCGSATQKHTDKHKQAPQAATFPQQPVAAASPYAASAPAPAPAGSLLQPGAQFNLSTMSQFGLGAASHGGTAQLERAGTASHQFDARSYFHGAGANAQPPAAYQPNAAAAAAGSALALGMYQPGPAAANAADAASPRHGAPARFRGTAAAQPNAGAGTQPTFYAQPAVGAPFGATPTSAVAHAQWPTSASSNAASSLGVSNASSAFGLGAQTPFGTQQAMFAYMPQFAQQTAAGGSQRSAAPGSGSAIAQQQTAMRKDSQTPTDMAMLSGAMQQMQLGVGGDFGGVPSGAGAFQQVAANGTRMPLGAAVGKQPVAVGSAAPGIGSRSASGPGGSSPPAQSAGGGDWSTRRLPSGGGAPGTAAPSNWWSAN